MEEDKKSREGAKEKGKAWQRASSEEKLRGIRSQNNLAFEELRKPRYNLSQAADGADSIDNGFELTVVDMAPVLADPGDKLARKEFAAALGAALEELGFAVLVGHGVRQSLYKAAHRRIPDVFRKLTDAEKALFRAERFGAVNQGYFPMEETSNLHPDQVEGWVWCRRAFLIPGGVTDRATLGSFWPSEEEEKFWRELVLEHQRLAPTIFRAMLDRVGVVRPEALVAELNDRRMSFALRLNYYPGVQNRVQRAVEAGAGRMVGHEDVDLFTLLPAPSAEGLQVLNHHTQTWIRVRPPLGAIILNTGDYSQRLFNDRFPSTTHRVAPPPVAQQSFARTSFPMAVYLPEDFVLSCLPECGKPRYSPMTALDFHTNTNRKYYGSDYRETGADNYEMSRSQTITNNVNRSTMVATRAQHCKL
eukprot:SAG31_NODE_2451_length_5667_cov_5.877694_4_plen_418_part_00